VDNQGSIKRWDLDGLDYKIFMDELKESIANTLGASKEDKEIFLFDLLPNHILLNKPKRYQTPYDPNCIVRTMMEKDRNKQPDFYQDMAITDYNKVGISKLALAVARLLNHPAITVFLPINEMESKGLLEDLINHTCLNYQKTRKSEESIKVDSEYLQLQKRFKEEYNSASRLAILKNIHVIINLELRYPQEYDLFSLVKPIYAFYPFISKNLSNLLAIPDPFGSFTYFNECVKRVIKKLDEKYKK